MMRWGHRSTALLGILVSLIRPAYADFSGQLQPGYSAVRTISTDSGTTEESQTHQFIQTYRAAINHAFFPNLTLVCGGVFDDRSDWMSSTIAKADGGARTMSAYSTLTLATPLLSSSLGVRWNDRSVAFGSDGSRALAAEELFFQANWRPVGLPNLGINVSRSHSHDRPRQSRDRRVDNLQGTARWSPAIPGLELRYSANALMTEDFINTLQSSHLRQVAGVDYSESFFDGRIAAHVGYTYANAKLWLTDSARPSLERQQFANGGLSTIERFPDVPSRVRLLANTLLTDGNTEAAAGIDLGFGVRVAGDEAYRDLGGQFSEPLPEIDHIRVYVDVDLPADVANGLHFDVYSSTDNQVWDPVGARGLPSHDPVARTFEIPIAPTNARFLKVVVQPLALGITTDPLYSAIQVTELEFFRTSLENTDRVTSLETHTVDASLVARILSGEELYFHSSLHLVAATEPGDTYTVSNGLSYTKTFNSMLSGQATVGRVDEMRTNEEHSGGFTWAAGLGFDPLSSLSHRIAYDGQFRGEHTRHSLSLINRLTVYQGAVLGAIGSAGLGEDEQGTSRRGWSLVLTADLDPHTKVGIHGTYSVGQTETNEGLTADRRVITGAVSIRPINVLYLSGNGTLSSSPGSPERLFLGYGISFLPFPDGSLQLGLQYSEAQEDDLAGTARVASTSLRWTIRSGTHLTSSYVFSQSRQRDHDGTSHVFTSKLTVAI